ncbi:unnamed protein product [Polarella glacialis]|uniref:SREBP regulating gene protein n=1 Tax=Polarella glacialis TaxID=89957 RepID=A0A813DAS0_POLGL|nr:unnamed protein product [Polarella glacialis]CAE8640491.1 unnamed protein product [Polarella glacialis]CAE8649750.1 unnamed protein product [Polarella glacialis]
MSMVSTAWIACWLLLHALVGSALAAAEGGSPGACGGTEACVEEALEDDPVALLQAPVRGAAVAAGADEDYWRRRAGRSVAATGAIVGSMTGEEASHTQAVQTQDLFTPSVGSVAVGGAANKRSRITTITTTTTTNCRKQRYTCKDNSECCSGKCRVAPDHDCHPGHKCIQVCCSAEPSKYRCSYDLVQ